MTTTMKMVRRDAKAMGYPCMIYRGTLTENVLHDETYWEAPDGR